LIYGRAATSKNFGGGGSHFGNDYDIIDVQSTMIYNRFAMISCAATGFFAKIS